METTFDNYIISNPKRKKKIDKEYNKFLLSEFVLENIDFSMSMEDMPLTNEDKNRLRDCLNGKKDIDKTLQEVIKKHTSLIPQNQSF